MAQAHHGQPLDKALCTGCHDPHASPNAKLIAARQHRPFADRQCEKCHQALQGGKVKLAAATMSELCESCHVQFKKRFEEAQVQHAALQLDDDSCITCHRAHASHEPALLKARVINLCITCHTDKPGNKKFVHDPAATLRRERTMHRRPKIWQTTTIASTPIRPARRASQGATGPAPLRTILASIDATSSSSGSPLPVGLRPSFLHRGTETALPPK
jgi:predicted CXXCH cytochrome family protein